NIPGSWLPDFALSQRGNNPLKNCGAGLRVARPGPRRGAFLALYGPRRSDPFAQPDLVLRKHLSKVRSRALRATNPYALNWRGAERHVIERDERSVGGRAAGPGALSAAPAADPPPHGPVVRGAPGVRVGRGGAARVVEWAPSARRGEPPDQGGVRARRLDR